MANNKLAKAIEEGFRLQEEYRASKAQADAAEQALKDHKKKLIATFTKTELHEVHTSLGTAKLVPKDIPQVDKDAGGWPAFYAYVVGGAVEAFFNDGSKAAEKTAKELTRQIAEHGNWELLEKRLGRKACQERWKDKVRIPGVKAFHTVDLKFGEGKEEE